MTSRDPHVPAGDSPGRAEALGPAATERDASTPAAGASATASPSPAPVPEASLGLRTRIWLGCVAGALVSMLGLWWVAGTHLTPNPDPPQLLGWLAAVGGLGLVTSIGFALWLDHGIVVHLRGLTRGLASGRVQELRGLPSATGWGELSELTEWAQVIITRQRLSNRATEDLERIDAALRQALESLDHWKRTDRWEKLPAAEGTTGDLGGALNDAFERAAETNEQNLEAARRVRAELIGAATDARDSAAQAERGFVESTAMLTTVRELQRLWQELRGQLASRAASASPPAAVAPQGGSPAESERRLLRYRESVESAIDELIASSNESVGHLGEALRRVQEIATQVQVVSQRATLVALHAITLESRLPREERRSDDLSRELRLLTAEVRDAARNADDLAAEVERETRAADERMREVRARVAPRLETPAPAAAPEAGTEATAAPAPAPLPDPALRLLERVREMIQDATQKGERLSSAGERASRTAARLVRRLEDESREIEGLMVRLSPAGALETGPDEEAGDDDVANSPGGLRLFDRPRAGEEREDAAPDDSAGETRVLPSGPDAPGGHEPRRTREDRP